MEKFYWAALNALPGATALKVPAMVQYFGSAEAAYKAEGRELAASKIVSGAAAAKLCLARRPEYPEQLAEFCYRRQVQLLTLRDPLYPEYLRHIYAPPAVLYVKGRVPNLTQSLGIVGSRRASAYGIKVAQSFAADLSAAGLVIVSGGAKGIDTAAHQGALSEACPTIAVLGCGIDISYPACNTELFEKIALTGAVLTEYPPGTKPYAYNFPQRNRIIAGLSRGILVVEAAKKSGAMITVELALEFGREVYCIPGSIFLPNSAGCHSLIKSGACLVDRPEDIVQDLLFWSQIPKGRNVQQSGQLLRAACWWSRIYLLRFGRLALQTGSPS